MTNVELLTNLVKSQGWKEFKKILKEKKLELAEKIIYKEGEDLKKEIEKIKAFDEIILIPENIVKADIIRNKNENSLGDLPDSLD